MYAVIDLETTGLDPARHDRIIEIAVVHVDDDGQRTGEWSTLVNPHRDLGPQHIHGISAAEARRAPTFAQLAPTIIDLLRGRVVVAHNLAFDAPFLAFQFQQIGLDTPLAADRGLCTMTLAATYLPGAGRSLAACCAAAGVPLDRAHCALDDTRAAAMLLGHYLAAAGSPVPWADALAASIAARWPAAQPAGAVPVVHRRAAGVPQPSFLSRLVDHLPRVSGPPAADRYLALLDRALVDRRISETDADGLVALAGHLGLGRREVLDLHRDYLAALGSTAISDGVVTPDDERELQAVALMLGLPGSSVSAALDPDPARIPRQRLRRFRLRRGDEIVFTGQTRPPREELEQQARDVGLEIGCAVTRTTRLLVAADVDTMSGKARAARAHSIPIVAPDTFAGFVDEMAGDSQAPADN